MKKINKIKLYIVIILDTYIFLGYFTGKELHSCSTKKGNTLLQLDNNHSKTSTVLEVHKFRSNI